MFYKKFVFSVFLGMVYIIIQLGLLKALHVVYYTKQLSLYKYFMFTYY